MNMILSTIVGSRLHGTHTEASDTDYRGVFMVPLKDKLSPFKDQKITHWMEGVGDADDTAYELGHYCKMAAQGNPSALEVLVGLPYTSTDMGEQLKKMLPHFLSLRCYEAFRGYARNQEKKFRNGETIRGGAGIDARKYKYACAHIRTLHQLLHLLVFNQLIGTYSHRVTQELKDIKNGRWTDRMIMSEVLRLEDLCEDKAKTTQLQKEPNIDVIEKFVYDAYRIQQ